MWHATHEYVVVSVDIPTPSSVDIKKYTNLLLHSSVHRAELQSARSECIRTPSPYNNIKLPLSLLCMLRIYAHIQPDERPQILRLDTPTFDLASGN